MVVVTTTPFAMVGYGWSVSLFERALPKAKIAPISSPDPFPCRSRSCLVTFLSVGHSVLVAVPPLQQSLPVTAYSSLVARRARFALRILSLSSPPLVLQQATAPPAAAMSSALVAMLVDPTAQIAVACIILSLLIGE